MEELQEQIAEVGRQASQIEDDNKLIAAEVDTIRLENTNLQDELNNVVEEQEAQRAEIDLARAEMIGQNHIQTSLIGAQLLFKLLETHQTERMSQVFLTISDYSFFDKKCQSNLRSLARCIRRQVRYAQTRAITRWYQNTLKPTGTSVLND